MENLVTSTMKIRTPSGEHIHHHPYAVGRINPASVTPSATLHPSQQIVASNTGDYNNDIEFYSGPSSHDVINWKNVGVSNNAGVLANPVHHSYGLPVNVNNVGRDPNSMDALAIRISTGNGSLGSRSDGTDLVIDDLIRYIWKNYSDRLLGMIVTSTTKILMKILQVVSKTPKYILS